MTIVEIGYLESTYLTPLNYLTGLIEHGIGQQVNMVIKKNQPISQQVEMYLTGSADDYSQGNQAEMFIFDKENSVGFQVQLQIKKQLAIGSQVELYLTGPSDDYSQGNQAEMFIVNRQKETGMQVVLRINNQADIGVQVELYLTGPSDDYTQGNQAEMLILDRSKLIGSQAEMVLIARSEISMQSFMSLTGSGDDYYQGNQAEMVILDKIFYQSMQAVMKIKDNLLTIGMQSLMSLEGAGDDHYLGMQSEMKVIEKLSQIGMQAKIFPLGHYICPVYLLRDYLTESYLAYCLTARQGMQVLMQKQHLNETSMQAEMYLTGAGDDYSQGNQAEMFILDKLNQIGAQTEMNIISTADDYYQGNQAEMVILKNEPIGSQAEMRVFIELPTGMQVNRLGSGGFSASVTMVLYNTQQLRILCDFASRGTVGLAGLNWTAIPAEDTGFNVNNVNTDVLEERTQSKLGTIGLWELRCNCGLPRFVDTAAILEHNLTRSARVTFQGTNDVSWGTVGFSTVLTTEIENMYYIAPSLPTISYQYWRLLIQDPTNTDNQIKIGTIVFGSARIFSVTETFENPVTYGLKHFKDTIDTEGFTNVSNDRAMRKFLGLQFRHLDFNGGNYALLKDYFVTAKTDLKCLVIPLPRKPSSLAVFAKLLQLPEESHFAIEDDEHRVELSLDWDESF